MENRKAFINRKEFRKWLVINHSLTEPIWIEFYKDGRKSIAYKEALEEALSFGWIDSTIKRIDDKIYVRKFLKRHRNSKWSEINKAIVQELITKGLMTEFGMQAIQDARNNGQWDKADEREDYIDIEGLRKVLLDKMEDINDFDKLSESLKNHYSLYYFVAKREETRSKRLEMIVEYMKTKRRFL
jgi:uncharacterized protein YdeI (YjbR/CyaY-like superfamily)